MILKITIVGLMLISMLNASDSFNKVMAKNRSSKKIGNSNYQVINGNKEYKKATKNGATIGLNISGTKVGSAYNYVDIKNVKTSKLKKNRSYGLQKIQKNQKKTKLIGVKANSNFRGTIHNSVSVKNSNLY